MESSYSRQYQELCHQHWWWRARHRLIMDKISHLLAGRRPGELPPALLDVGCGGGVYFDDYQRFGQIHGLEPDAMLATSLPRWRDFIEMTGFEGGYQSTRRYDLVLMLDVLEHIADDGAALANAARLLKPGGHL